MKNSFIGIIANDSAELTAGLLGILKSGNTFVPISPAIPNDRIDFIIRDCGIKILLADRANYPKAKHVADACPWLEHLLCIEDELEKNRPASESRKKNTGGEYPCYLIYTSGTTGQPKGVPITHRNLIPLFTWFREYFKLGTSTRVMQNLSYIFDFGVFEILTTVLYGGSLHLLDKGGIGEFSFYGWYINRHGIDTVHSTPVFFSHVAAAAPAMPSLRLVHLGGERLTGKMAGEIAAVVPRWCLIHNGYGPTEATINCSIFTLTAEQAAAVEESAGIPIGHPTAWNILYILDKNHGTQPIGAAGELCVAGAGLAHGYLNRPELTAEKFIIKSFLGGPGGRFFKKAPMAVGDKIYKTGDLTRWMPDGNIEFLGRIDFQVKVRGYRIELGEIESRLLTLAGIKDAIVIAREHENGSHYLCAYYVIDPGKMIEPPRVSRLREHLAADLPDYMIPAYFIPLESLPMTATGKVDRKRLPEPDPDAISTGVEYVPPTTGTEKDLARIWQELLRKERIGVMEDFFELGGDSILANRCIARIREDLRAEIPLRKFFEQPYIKAMAAEIEKTERREVSIPKGDRKEGIPLSFAQERLWFLQELDAESVAYFVPRVIRITGSVKKELFEQTFTEIILRHEILRTRFVTIDGQPVQQVYEPYDYKIPLLDWSAEEESQREQKVSRYLEEESRKPFDFEKGVLLRVALLKLKEAEHLFVLTEHHLVHDGWTQGVLLREFIEIFTALGQGRPCPLPELPIQYADFAIWQRRYLQGEVLDRHLDYWKKRLTGAPPVLDLPGDRPRPPAITGKGGMIPFRISPAMTANLKEFGKKHNTTLFMTMLTVFKLFLYRYTGVQDLCVGTGIANRRYKEMEGMLGMVINTLPLRTVLNGHLPVSECLGRVRETCLEAYQHEDTPFGKIVEVMQPERSLSYMPVFQVMFSFMDTPTEDLHLPGLELELLDFHNRSSKFDINIVAVPPPEPGRSEVSRQPVEDILVEWEYSTDIFNEDTAARMVSHYSRLLEEMLRYPEKAPAALSMLSEAEIRQLLWDFNDTARDYPSELAIQQLFIRQAETSPDSIALSGISAATSSGPVQVTYQELHNRSGHCFEVLIEQGITSGAIVAIKMDRSIEVLIAILGILKSGGAYMPIDPGYPEERINYMLNDSQAGPVITAEWLSSLGYRSNRSYTSNKSLQPRVLAYIMYTSGTTGRPKGVMVEHRNVLRLVINSNFVVLSDKTRILQTGAPVFDATTFEYWGTLLHGGQLVLVNNDTILDAHRLGQALEQYEINTLWLSSPLFNQLVLVNSEIFKPLYYLLVGGDVLSPANINLVASKNKQLNIINGYGPTENTTFSTTSLIEKEYRETIPIGKPIANSTAYIVDRNGNFQPIGAVGELWVGGEGVALGYMNNPELTSEKFVLFYNRTYRSYRSNMSYRSYQNERLYRTGDLARWLPDGNIEFMGRVDTQVKIRGFRIELSEIENCLLKLSGVKEAVVMARQNPTGEKYLCAYIASETELLPAQLKQDLGKELPEYMIPAFFVFLQSLPLNPNGKVDRKALPEPGAVGIETTYTPPRTPIEEQLVHIWAGVLHRDTAPAQIGIDDNFFDLGGHSLKATLMLARIHQVLKVRVPLTEIFIHPTIRALGEVIEKTAETSYTPVIAVEEKEYYPLSSTQKRMYILQQLGEQESNTVYNIPYAAELKGNLDEAKLEAVFKRLIVRHESLRTSFHIVEGQPVQVINSAKAFKIVVVNGAVPAPAPTAPSSRPTLDSLIRPFDLSQAPLLRVKLIKHQPQHHILFVEMHHIISDGISMDILAREFMGLYAGKELPRLVIGYKDFSVWLNTTQGKHLLEQQGKYWYRQLAGEIPVLNLPLDYPRPVTRRFEGHTLSFQISKEETQALKHIAGEQGATLFMVLLSIYYVFLSRLSGQEDIVVGTPVGGRRLAGLDTIIGMFVNTLALRHVIASGQSFTQFLAQVKAQTLEAFNHQDYPYEELVETVAVERDPGRNPLFDTMFTLQNLDIAPLNIPGLELKPYDYTESKSKFDFMLTALEADSLLEFRYQYCVALFKEESIARFIDVFKQIVTTVAQNPGIPLEEIEIITVVEKERILHEFNATRRDYPAEDRIHRVFTAQAENTPDTLALSGISESSSWPVQLTYAVLNSLSENCSCELIEKGVIPGAIVAIQMERSIEMMIAILGILKSGGAYMPIDPGYPEERINYMLEDSRAGLVITAECLSALGYWANRSFMTYMSYTSNKALQPRALAYIMYTSGTTGRPKGVMVEHRSVLRLVMNTGFVPLSAKTRILQTGAPVFDATTFEYWGTLLNGGQLVLVNNDTILDALRLGRALERYDIDTLWLTSPLFNQLILVNPEIFKPLEYILVGGDVLSPSSIDLAASKNKQLKIINGYGPTENTTFSTTFLIEKEYRENIPIGKPIANSTAYIVDRTGALLPVGIPGELLVGGDGVARGYMNNPELTSERFGLFFYRSYRSNMSYRSYQSKKLYRTGDLARWLPDGNIEFLGRVDSQVKIRGFRIELSEIEHCLLKLPGVKEAAVMARQNPTGEKYLCAYISKETELLPPQLKQDLGKELPEYMIPSFFVFLESLPLNLNGKVDRKALPEPGSDRTGAAYTPPRTPMEAQLVRIWSAAIFKDNAPVPIGIDDNFFELGGHSLKATLMLARIHQVFKVNVPLTEIFIHPTVRELGEVIRQTAETPYTPVTAVEEKEYYPLSSAQKRMYILQHLGKEEENTVYNIPYAAELLGTLDMEKMEAVFNRLIERHESLRTSFRIVNGQPVQVINAVTAFQIVTISGAVPAPALTAPSPVPAVPAPASWVPDQVLTGSTPASLIRPFDLEQAPLLRVELIKLPAQRHILFLDMHHIISDGLSMDILAREFMALYAGKELPALSIRYKDFSVWLNTEEGRQSLEQQGKYWHRQFTGDIPVLNLPLDYTRPVAQSFEGHSLGFQIGTEETLGLKRIASEHGATLFMVLLSIYYIFLSRLSGQEDIVVGTPVGGRRLAGLDTIIGMFVNTLALRQVPGPDYTFTHFLERVKAHTLDAFNYQDYPYERLVEYAAVDRDPGRNPLFDTMFTLQNLDIATVNIPGLELLPYEYDGSKAKFDFMLNALEAQSLLEFRCRYCTALFRKESILRFIDYFKHIVAAVVRNPGIRLGEIGIISPGEKERILGEFNATRADYPDGERIHGIVNAWAENTPDSLALSGISETSAWPVQLTYAALNTLTERRACDLIEKGVIPGAIVAIKMERSIEMIIAILGILKSGGAYMPIDPGYPEERINYMLKDSKARLVMTAELLSSLEYGSNRSDTTYTSYTSNKAQQPRALAYIMYTSGTTGRPKGVMVEHRNILRLAINSNFVPLSEKTRLLSTGAPVFDASTLEWWGTLLNGGQLVLVNNDAILDAHRLGEVLERHAIDTLFLTSPLFNQLALVNQEIFKPLAYLMVGGDVVSPVSINLAVSSNAGLTIINCYGPTENTVISTTFLIEGEYRANIPIGKPIANSTAYIVNTYGALLPVGIPGELLVGGDGVARGYMNKPELTSEKFIIKSFLGGPGGRFFKKAPMAVGDKIYRTGDLARWLADGNIEFLGRIDRQVKIRGFRIELEEIEAQLLGHTLVKEAKVIARENKDHEKYLAAYLVPARPSEPSEPGRENIISQLREYLSHRMPGHMVPGHFITLEKMPLAPSGKIDTKALPDPGDARPELGVSYLEPQTGLEIMIADIWKETLGLPKLGIYDNFFELGGTSLSLVQVYHRLKSVAPKEIALVDLFRYTSIAALVKYFDGNGREEPPGNEQNEQRVKSVDKGKTKLMNLRKKARSE